MHLVPGKTFFGQSILTLYKVTFLPLSDQRKEHLHKRLTLRLLRTTSVAHNVTHLNGEFGFWSRVTGRGSWVTSRGSRVNGRGSRVTSRGSKNSSRLFLNVGKSKFCVY